MTGAKARHLPSGWHRRKLGDIARFKTGPFGSSIHGSDYVVGGVPLINPMHLVNGHIVSDERTTVSEAVAKLLSDFRVTVGDIVLGRRGDMGRCAVVTDQENGWICGTGSMIVRLVDSIDVRFLQRVLSSQEISATLEAASIGSTMSNLNQRILATLELSLPVEKREQTAIADALSDVDAWINSLEKLIDKSRAVMQGAMRELLSGRRRVPGFAARWRKTTLAELGQWKGGMTPSMAERGFWENGTVPWVSSGDVKAPVLFETAKCVTCRAVTERRTTRIPKHSIMLVMRSGILRRYLPVAIAAVPLTINQDIKALLPSEAFDPKFLLYAIVIQGPAILATCMKTGTTVESIELSWLKAFEIEVPARDEQSAIACVLSDMDAEVAALEAKLAKVRDIKQGMMQELLSGRVRLV